jgi:hypothetical protein
MASMRSECHLGDICCRCVSNLDAVHSNLVVGPLGVDFVSPCAEPSCYVFDTIDLRRCRRKHLYSKLRVIAQLTNDQNISALEIFDDLAVVAEAILQTLIRQIYTVGKAAQFKLRGIAHVKEDRCIIIVW